jgi:hypothetical protein
MLLGYAHGLPELFESLTPTLQSLLEHRDEQAQLKTLQILQALLPSITRERVETVLLPILCPVFSRHENAECRYDICFSYVSLVGLLQYDRSLDAVF